MLVLMEGGRHMTHPRCQRNMLAARNERILESRKEKNEECKKGTIRFNTKREGSVPVHVQKKDKQYTVPSVKRWTLHHFQNINGSRAPWSL